MNNKSNSIIKVIIVVLVLALLGIGGYGTYTYLHREVDTTDYTVTKEEETDFEYDEEVDYEYVEDRITFSSSVEDKLSSMSNEEKVAKLFILSTSEISNYGDINSFYDSYHILGVLGSIDEAYTINSLNDYVSTNYGSSILKIASDYKEVADYYSTLSDTPMDIGTSGDDDLNREYISDIAYGLKELGYDIVLGPNCNISISGQEYDVDSYGTDSISNSDMIETAIDTYKENGIWVIAYTFPYISQRDTNIETLEGEDLMEFQCAIDNNVEAIMLSKAICRPVTESASLPVFMSENTSDVLRAKMGFNGVIISPDIYDYRSTEYSYSEVCIKAINSGVDVLYNPSNFTQTYDDVLNAVNTGEISETRIDNAVGRVLTMTMD